MNRPPSASDPGSGPQGAGPPGAAAAKRRIYLRVSAAGALVTLIPWVFGLPGGLPAGLARWAYPVAALLAATVWTVLWRRWVSFQVAERGLCLALIALLLALQLSSNLRGEPASFQLQLSVLSVTLVAYLAYPQRLAAVLSLLLFGLTLGCALGAALWLGRPPLSLLQPALQLQLGAALMQLWVAINFNRQTEQERRYADQLYQQARVDPLTGVANRRALYEALDRTLPQGNPLSVVLLDLDDFKAVNDLHGHLIGDEVLRHLGHLLHQHVRHGDVVGRWGGEEFLLVLPNTDHAQALEIAGRILWAVRRQTWPAQIPLTASFGVASAASGEPQERLTERADVNLYRAKALGRNRVHGDA